MFLIGCTAKSDYSTCTGAFYPTINLQGRGAEYSAAFISSFAKVSKCTSTAFVCSHIVHKRNMRGYFKKLPLFIF